jgi:hypothetical protein
MGATTDVCRMHMDRLAIAYERARRATTTALIRQLGEMDQ